MGRSPVLIAAVALSACGRLGFDPAKESVDANDGMALSCATLPSTCGPTGSSPCCESPIVVGGTFSRSYDVALDTTYPDMSHPATVSTFRLDKYEVTVGRFRQFVNSGSGTQANPPPTGAGARTLDGRPSQGGWDPAWNARLAASTLALVAAVKCFGTYQTWTDTPADNENRPMNCITWYEAMAFCAWDGGFVSTESEWNYAAAGGDEQRAYPWSTPSASLAIDDTKASYNVDAIKECYGDGVGGCALTDLVAVGSKPAGSGMWGQSDLGGNVWEWVLDGYAAYADPCNDCATLTTTSPRVRRGGSFIHDDSYLRGAFRLFDAPTVRGFYIGVRCARAS